MQFPEAQKALGVHEHGLVVIWLMETEDEILKLEEHMTRCRDTDHWEERAALICRAEQMRERIRDLECEFEIYEN